MNTVTFDLDGVILFANKADVAKSCLLSLVIDTAPTNAPMQIIKIDCPLRIFKKILKYLKAPDDFLLPDDNETKTMLLDAFDFYGIGNPHTLMHMKSRSSSMRELDLTKKALQMYKPIRDVFPHHVFQLHAKTKISANEWGGKDYVNIMPLNKQRLNMIMCTRVHSEEYEDRHHIMMFDEYVVHSFKSVINMREFLIDATYKDYPEGHLNSKIKLANMDTQSLVYEVIHMQHSNLLMHRDDYVILQCLDTSGFVNNKYRDV